MRTDVPMTTHRKYLLLTALLAAALLRALPLAAEPTAFRDSVVFNGEKYYYYTYIPETLQESRPLVIMLHGYGGKADGYRPEMLEEAQRQGFAVCIPQGLTDPRGKSGWNVGYPSQQGMDRDDAGFVCMLARLVPERWHLRKDNVFLCGMSNGGEMCYLIGYRYPAVFRAIASIAGLTMEWIYKTEPPQGRVPFMEVHGTADKTSHWEGDPENTGGWGRYISVPAAVAFWVGQNRCTVVSTEALPQKGECPVTLYRYTGGEPSAWGQACEVRLYEVTGGTHSWALKNLDTCAEVWKFFSQYLPDEQ